MKIKVESIELVKGSTINPCWKADMRVINGQYYSSTISSHNPNKQPFDGVVGKTYEVGVSKDNWIWIK